MNLTAAMAIRRRRMRGRKQQQANGPRYLQNILRCLLITPLHVTAMITCQPGDEILGDALCATKYRPGSYCIPNSSEGRRHLQDIPSDSNTFFTAGNNTNTAAEVSGSCSNPFVSGCLRNYLGEETFKNKRVCNSEDSEGAAERGECATNEFGYEEIRILNQNWEGPMFSSWIMQILLSELLGVPATIETSTEDGSFNFYDPGMGFSYSPDTYDFDALRRAFKQGELGLDCKQFQEERKKNNEPYESCAHVIPESWKGNLHVLADAIEEGFVEPTTGAGGVGKLSWYIPKFTAKREPQLLLLGLNSSMDDGADNTIDLAYRQKLANTFLRPQTWGFFCEENDCTSPFYNEDGQLIAAQPPADETEAGRYFVEGLFHGHFAPTEENDCDTNPFTCTGHIANVRCDWTTYVVGQAHHLGIPVKSNGPGVAGGYSYGSMVDIYHASNYTHTNILFYWYEPDPLVQEFVGTDAEFMRVSLPAPSDECKAARTPLNQRCSENSDDLIGDAKGACDSELDHYQKVIVANLRPDGDVDEASMSPAYDAIRSLKISEYQLEHMFREWLSRGVDRWNYDPRDSVCLWAAENLSYLQRFVPESYPRTKVVEKFDNPASYVALVIATIAMIMVLVVSALTWKNQTKKIFVYAQPSILFMLLLGLMLICTGAILYATVPPTDGTCMAQSWTVLLGSVLQIVPLAVKVAAINKIMQASIDMRRVEVTPSSLFKVVGVVFALAAIYLAIWTAVDPRSLQSQWILTEEFDDGASVVKVAYSCDSEISVWGIICFAIQFLLFIPAAVIAFQNRHMKSAFNESMYLSLVIYSQSMFTLIRAIIYFLNTNLEWEVIATASSFLLSFDAMTTLGIYFFPKLAQMDKRTRVGYNERQRETVGAIRRRVQQKLNSNRNVTREDLIVTKPEALHKEVRLLKKDNISLREQNAELVKFLTLHHGEEALLDLERLRNKPTTPRRSSRKRERIPSVMTNSTNTSAEFPDEMDLLNQLWDMEDRYDEDDYTQEEVQCPPERPKRRNSIVRVKNQELPTEESDIPHQTMKLGESPIKEEEYFETNGSTEMVTGETSGTVTNGTSTTSVSTTTKAEHSTFCDIEEGLGGNTLSGKEESPHQQDHLHPDIPQQMMKLDETPIKEEEYFETNGSSTEMVTGETSEAATNGTSTTSVSTIQG